MLELALTARELGRAAVPSASGCRRHSGAGADRRELVGACRGESGEVTALAVRADRIPATTSVQISATV
jgi:hypothetical protein